MSQANQVMYTSQSASSCYGECHRKRFLTYHFMGTGLTLRSAVHRVHLDLGTAVDAAVTTVVGNGLDTSLAPTFGAGETMYQLTSKYRPALHPSTSRDQTNLAQVLAKLWVLLEWPKIQEHYTILAVQPEIAAQISDDVVYQSRPDMVLEHTRSGEVSVYSLKCIKTANDWWLQAYKISNQVFTEPFFTAQFLKRTPTATRFCFLIKGDWKERNKGQGDWFTKNPFLYGYRKLSAAGAAYAWSTQTYKPENVSGYGKLGKGWEEFDIAYEYEGGVDQWISDLSDGTIRPDLGDGLGTVFDKYVLSEPFINVNLRGQAARSRLVQIMLQEKQIAKDLREVDPEEANSPRLDKYFPFNTHNCYFPSRCEFLSICRNGNPDYRDHIASKPLDVDDTPYMRRVPHHEAERKAMGDDDVPF